MSAFAFALITAFFWGLAPILGKLGLNNLSPFAALSLRSFVISGILLISGIITGQFKNLSVETGAFLSIAGEGIAASLLGHLFYFYALKHGEVSKIVPITSAFPLIALVLSMLFLHEKITAVNGLGVLLIIMGIILTKM